MSVKLTLEFEVFPRREDFEKQKMIQPWMTWKQTCAETQKSMQTAYEHNKAYGFDERFCQDQDPIAIAYQAKKIHEECVLYNPCGGGAASMKISRPECLTYQNDLDSLYQAWTTACEIQRSCGEDDFCMDKQNLLQLADKSLYNCTIRWPCDDFTMSVWETACNVLQSTVDTAYDLAETAGKQGVDAFCLETSKELYMGQAKAVNADCKIDWPCSSADSMKISFLLLAIFAFLMMKN
ncbi:Oidioi.mRNA.OKI2018_I69.PAR.g10006.t1.cds [Oikopleura dioica]|uniref:Oidioi.mRNA.OKI2018_I69.PAR.g10006.t1.cds n=1 Tax=Oikopleura dioica TaxID=34765 RepID=A0ABN7RW43_OIKDI|nr:Oidioi.mRNA.OKI2018_I69.PAR.g10006.t1.cds [Oikopleura dioica]